ncbi:RmlC-like cupin domain-containing protein [Lipomyces tetrasporus]|uniref:RmlC-like cupin domain-containing protein n=1 Tax=Lipomyces tetrasporus TaxID=54092 RepID=A0AAD7QQ24_9ASCO|nr:RmlC-like cupin domain-containing protein [Lipomyces tetrasporus]KAJ8098886.1 RmlC-like cupin domain-containing protein [Lipomyces tetrasporus]
MPMIFKKGASSEKPPHIANNNAFLGDCFTSETDPEHQITSGFYRQEAGTPLVYTYTYDEMKVILEGNFTMKDETGYEVTAGPGDTFYFKKGCTITFSSTDYGLAFFVGLRPKGTA